LESQTVPRPTKSRARSTLLYFAFTLALVTYLDRICISAAAPFMMTELGLSMFQMSLVFSAFTLAYSIFEVPTGWMGDMWGPRRVLTRIVVWWSAFTMLTGVAWNYSSLLITRFLFGAGEAGAFPNISRSFSRWFPLVERGRANGVLFLGSRLGGALAPGIALVFIRWWGWRMSFLVFGSIGILWALAWFRWYRDEPSAHPSVGPEELAWIRQDENAAPAPPQTRTDVPWKQLLINSNIHAICGMYFAFGYGLYFYFTWLPTYLTKALGFVGWAGGVLAGLPFLLAGLADMAGGWLTDRLAHSYRLKVARCWLGCVAFSGSAVLLFISTQAQHRVAKAIWLATALASADLALSACWAVCVDVGKDYAGVVTGLMNTFGNLGGVLGPVVVAAVLERGGNSWEIPFYISAVIYAVGALLWLVIDPTRRISHKE
jgi:MFS transporter, ACS family, glucarate transporter